MKNRTTLLLVGLIIVVVGVGLVVGLGQRGANALCSDSHPVKHAIVIKDGKASDTNVQGELCDTLTYTNEDNITREVAFGPHENHVPYDGVPEKFLNKGQSFTITFVSVGKYHWHDHLHDEIEGYFTVTK